MLGEETKRCQEISGKKTLGIPTLLTKQNLRGQPQLSVTLPQNLSKTGRTSQGHSRLGSDVRLPMVEMAAESAPPQSCSPSPPPKISLEIFMLDWAVVYTGNPCAVSLSPKRAVSAAGSQDSRMHPGNHSAGTGTPELQGGTIHALLLQFWRWDRRMEQGLCPQIHSQHPGQPQPPRTAPLVCDTAKREFFFGWTFVFAGKFQRVETTEQRSPPGLWRRRKWGIVQCRGQGLGQWDRAKFKTSYLGDHYGLRVILGFPTFSWQILGTFLPTKKRKIISISPSLSLQLAWGVAVLQCCP